MAPSTCHQLPPITTAAVTLTQLGAGPSSAVRTKFGLAHKPPSVYKEAKKARIHFGGDEPGGAAGWGR